MTIIAPAATPADTAAGSAASPASRLSYLPHLVLPLAMLLVLLYLIVRNHGLFPVVFLDEWAYSRDARLAPLAEALVPSYLYLGLFRATNACGAGFLECARIGNAVLFVLAAPFIYRVARPLTGRAAAIMVTVFTLLGGMNSVTAYFMPESMYFLGFWVLTWAVLGEVGGTGWRGGFVAGVLLGLMSLVKVHALFLLPAMVLYMVWRSWRDGRLRTGVGAALLMVLTMLAVKAGLGWILAGPPGLSVLGNFYGGIASSSTDRGDLLTRLLQPAAWNLYGHLMALVLLWALPLLAFAGAAVSRPARAAVGQPGRNTLVYTVLTLGATLGMTVLYTASIAHVAPMESSRLHLRYYDFVFPLLAIVAASPLVAHRLDWRVRVLLGVLVGILMAFATSALRPDFQLSFVDGPELVALAADKSVFYKLMLAQLLVLALWCWRPQLGRHLFVWLLLPLLAINAELSAHRTLQGAVALPQLPDRVGMALHQQLTQTERDHLLIIGDDDATLPRAQFQVDNHATQVMGLPPGAPIQASMISRDIKVVAVMGQHPLPPELQPQFVTPDYALIRLAAANAQEKIVARISFNAMPDRQVLRAVQGLHPHEAWGAWSEGRQVVLHFSRPLPRELTVQLQARAYGPNTGEDFTLRVGEVRRTFRLGTSLGERNFRLQTDGAQSELVIDIPQPISPQQFDGSADIRVLGIGLATMEIGEVSTDADAGKRPRP